MSTTPSTPSNVEVLRVTESRVADWWPFIAEGLTTALSNSGNFRDLSSIYDNLVSGGWVLWVVVKEDELLGAAVTEVISSEQGLYCNVAFGWSKDPAQNIHPIFFPFIEEKARKMGFAGTKFVSSRKGYTRKAEQMGYKVGFVEYRKTFNEVEQE